MLTTAQDNLTGTAGNDTFTANAAVVINSTDGSQSLTNTLQAVDIINGGAGVDTLSIVSASGTVTLPSISNVEVISAQSLVGLTLNTTTVSGLTNLNVTKAGAAGIVAATAAATTDVNVSMAAVGAKIDVAGGKNVAVNLTGVAGTADVVNVGVGGLADPAGTVTVSTTGSAYTTATADTTLSGINVTGGTTIAVTQKASASTAAAAADTTATTITQGAVAIVGNATTTQVTVTQDAAVAAKNATFTTGGATESASVKFGALSKDATLTAGGLTFTANAAMTAAEVAAVFANLVNGTLLVAGDTQGSGLASKGTYTNAFATSGATGFTSAAASGDTVVFTAATANANPADLAFTLAGTVGTSVAPVVTTTQGKANDATGTGGVMGVVAGAVTIDDAGSSITTVTANGYSVTGSAVTAGGTKLATLNLTNGGAFTTSNAAATLALNLENVAATAAVAATSTAAAVAATAAAVTVSAGAATLNVKSTGANFANLSSAATTALNVSGTGLLTASASTLGAVKAITVTETAGLNLGTTALTSVESVNTTGTTGAVTVSIDGSKASYTGGAGVDTVTVTTAAVDKAVSLGAGNDRLVLTAATPVIKAGLVVEGGDGTDTLSLTAADAASLSAGTVFETLINGFERLEVGVVGAATTVNFDNMDDINSVISNGSGAFAYKLDKMLSGATVELKAAHTNGIEVALKDATGTEDALNLIANAATNTNIGTVTAAGVETINVTANDTDVSNTVAVSSNTLTLAAAAAKTINVSGAGKLALSLGTLTKAATLVDGSTATGALTIASSAETDALAVTIKGGAGADILTISGGKADVLQGGAGADTLNAGTGLGTLTGGEGNDLFVVGAASANVNSWTTITDFSAGDLLKFNGMTGFTGARVNLGDTAVFQDLANAAVNAQATGVGGWFQFGGNTYVVADIGANGTAGFVNGEDFIVKLTGLVDLSNASFNATQGTIALV